MKWQDKYLNKIVCDDAFVLINEIPDESVDLILTDIPYNITKPSNFHTMPDRANMRTGTEFGEWDQEEFMIHKLILFERVIKLGGSFILFSAFEQYGTILNCLGLMMDAKDRLILESTNPMPRNVNRRYVPGIQFLSWFVKPGGKWTFNKHEDVPYEKPVLRFPAESGGGYKRYHPTQKPLGALKYILSIHSNPGDVVLDPFIGGGSTAVACIESGRQFIGIEIDEAYCNSARERGYKVRLRTAGHRHKFAIIPRVCNQCSEVVWLERMARDRFVDEWVTFRLRTVHLCKRCWDDYRGRWIDE